MTTDSPAPDRRRSAPLFYIGWIVALIVVIVAVSGLVLAHNLGIVRQTSELKAAAEQSRVVLVTQAILPNKHQVIELPGDIHGFFESPIYPKVSGYVARMLVDKGMRVTKNQLLAVIESPELDHQVADARATYEIAELTDRRNQALVRNAVIPQQTADESRAIALEDYNAWRSLLAQQGYERVIAPYDGIITERNVDPGALVATATAQNSAVPIVSMATLRPLRVYVNMPQEDSAFVRDGDPATITVAEYPRRKFTGTVTRHPEALMNATRTMLVEVDLANDDGLLLPGMYARMSIQITANPTAPLVPDRALIFKGDKVFVPVVEDGTRLHLVEVELGFDDGINVQITDGLSGGETVAINVGQAAQEGESVRPHQAPAGVD